MKYDRSTVSQWAADSQWRACKADLTRYRLQGYSGWGSEGFWALAIYRLQKAVGRHRPRWLWAPVRLTLGVVKKLLSVVTLIDLHPDAEIGPGTLICHGGPLRIHADTTIGADCAFHGGCTIGAGPRPGGAVIGDHVFIGCQASIIGAVTIGDDAKVAANSLVISDIPPGCTAIGVPAKLLPVIFRCSSSPASVPSAQPEENISGRKTAHVAIDAADRVRSDHSPTQLSPIDKPTAQALDRASLKRPGVRPAKRPALSAASKERPRR